MAFGRGVLERARIGYTWSVLIRPLAIVSTEARRLLSDLRGLVAADEPVLCGCWGNHICADCSLVAEDVSAVQPLAS